MVNQGPSQSDDQLSGKRVSGMRRLERTLVVLSDRQCANTIIVMPKDYRRFFLLFPSILEFSLLGDPNRDTALSGF